MSVTLTIEGPNDTRTWNSEVGTETLFVGRDAQCEIVISDSSVSRRHLRLTVDDERVSFEDLGSVSGVFLIEADGGERRVRSGVLGLDQRLRVAHPLAGSRRLRSSRST
jgi:pSer/pThr/pTyr-binding forkhead associated (FHA) protein